MLHLSSSPSSSASSSSASSSSKGPAPLVALLGLLLVLGGCASDDPPLEPSALVGSWRAVLESPGGDLPFGLRVDETAGGLRAVALNGGEEAPFTGVAIDGDRIVFKIDWYDSEITAERTEPDRLEGTWRRTSAGGVDSTLPFRAVRGTLPRFEAPSSDLVADAATDGLPTIEGDWRVVFVDQSSVDDGGEAARGEFRRVGPVEGRDGAVAVEGTFLTPTGDYRFLDGTYEQGVLRLSTFDGAHAFLFHAVAEPDGGLRGDFWSRDVYHATWTARPLAEGEEVLPDAWSLAGLTNDEGRFHFEFPNLDGETVTLDDPRFDDKVVIVNLFGTWCPNCNDEAPLLAAWAKRYADQGLEIVGLAYEFTGDPERDRTMVSRFRDRHAISYPLLLAGTSDKSEAAATLPDLDRVVAYPTSIFIGRDGKVRRIHSGFAGPGTGRHHAELVDELETYLRELLAEPA